MLISITSTCSRVNVFFGRVMKVCHTYISWWYRRDITGFLGIIDKGMLVSPSSALNCR